MEADVVIMQKKEKVIFIITAMLFGALTFIMIYGIKVVDVGYTDWLMSGGDLTQHWLGWKFYRKSDWMFPYGLCNNIAYPFETSIVFTDSIPIFAVLFKIFSPILPSDFQYFGLWGVLCFAFQGMLGAIICRKYMNSVNAVISSTFFNLQTIMIFRMYNHTALASQWVLLLALLPIIYFDKIKSNKQMIAFWTFLGALCAGIHMYLLAMCGIILLGYVIYDFAKKRSWKVVYSIFSFVLAACIHTYVLGGFSSNMLASTGGLGEHGFNILGFFNSYGNSVILKEIPVLPGNTYEGITYLGAGVIVLIIIAACAMIEMRKEKADKCELIAIVFIIVVSVMVAISPKVYMGENLIIDLWLPNFVEKVWGVFRASARFVWTVVYILLILGLRVIFKFYGKTTATFVVCLALLIQVWDMHRWLGDINNIYTQNKDYIGLSANDDWDVLTDSGDIQHIYVSPELRNQVSALYSIADWAVDNELTLNNFYFARTVKGIAQNYESAMKEPEEEEIFIFVMGEDGLSNTEFTNYYIIDEFVIGTEAEFEELDKYMRN